jgi:hypothetical protein
LNALSKLTKLLALPEKELTYFSGILTLVDGHLNPCLFWPPLCLSSRTPEQEAQYAEEVRIKRLNKLKFRETYRNLNSHVKNITITFKDGHKAILDPKDPKYGWRIRWSIRDLLKEAVLPKKLGFDEYGYNVKKEL